MPSLTKACSAIDSALLFAAFVGGCDNGMGEAASAPTVEVNFSFGQKTFGDYDYESVDTVVRGIVQRDDGSTGKYEVPVKLAYPVGGGNGLGVVDLVTDRLERARAGRKGTRLPDCYAGLQDLFGAVVDGVCDPDLIEAGW